MSVLPTTLFEPNCQTGDQCRLTIWRFQRRVSLLKTVNECWVGPTTVLGRSRNILATIWASPCNQMNNYCQSRCSLDSWSCDQQVPILNRISPNGRPCKEFISNLGYSGNICSNNPFPSYLTMYWFQQGQHASIRKQSSSLLIWDFSCRRICPGAQRHPVTWGDPKPVSRCSNTLQLVANWLIWYCRSFPQPHLRYICDFLLDPNLCLKTKTQRLIKL